MRIRALLTMVLCVLMPTLAWAQAAQQTPAAQSAAGAPSAQAQNPQEQNPMFVVSVDKANLNPDAAIMGFDVRIQSGSVLVAPLLPKGWEMLIRNFIVQTPPWHSTMNATAEEGAEGIDMSAFQRFLIVEQDPDLMKEEPFTVEVGLITTTDGATFGITWLPKDAVSLTPFNLP